MSASARRCAVCAGVCMAAIALVGPAGAADPTPATINDWCKEVNERPRLSKVVEAKYKSALTINLPFSKDYNEAIRQVLEMRVARMALGERKGLQPPAPLDAPKEDIRREWRLSTLKDLRVATSPHFRDEVTTILAPILTAMVLGYKDAKGQPDKAVRVNAVLLLVRQPGPHQAKTNALLRLLRTKGVDEGSLFTVIRELGRLKIVAAVPALVSILSTPNVVLQAAAARALGSIGDDAALDPLLVLLARAGDTATGAPEQARDVVAATIAGIRGVAAVNELGDRTPKVLAALMRRVLTDPDRMIVAAATEAIRDITAYPESLKPTLPEEEFQRGIERLRVWWLRQKGAKEYYERLFRLEPFSD